MAPRRTAQLLALLIPLGLIGGALYSQYVGGLFPCEMCMWQRWPHYAAIGLAALSFVAKPARGALVWLAALAIAVSGAIGAFHVGVEYGWWEGLTRCATNFAGGGSTRCRAGNQRKADGGDEVAAVQRHGVRS